MALKSTTPYDKINIADSHSATIELQIQGGFLKMHFVLIWRLNIRVKYWKYRKDLEVGLSMDIKPMIWVIF